MMGTPTPRWHIPGLGTPAKSPFPVILNLTGRDPGGLIQFRSDLVQICTLHPCHLARFPVGLEFFEENMGLIKGALLVQGAGVTDINILSLLLATKISCCIFGQSSRFRLGYNIGNRDASLSAASEP